MLALPVDVSLERAHESALGLSSLVGLWVRFSLKLVVADDGRLLVVGVLLRVGLSWDWRLLLMSVVAPAEAGAAVG